jgi:hypothetical protein
MAQQTINVGTSPNDGTGTPLRTAFQYTNSNFSELYTAVGPSGNNIVVPGTATITGDLTVDTSTLKVDSANNRVGIVNASPTRALDVVGSAIVSSEIRCSSFDTGTTSGDLYLFTSNRLSQTAAPTIECQNSAKPLIINHTGSQSMLFGIGGSLQMTLNSTGLLVGTTSAGGSASNSAKSVAGFFSTVNGSTASTASGVAVTMFASPNEATFIVSAYIFGTGAPATYNAVAIVKVSGGVATVTAISSSTSTTISVSGLNVQATQTSGAAQVIVYSAIRIS